MYRVLWRENIDEIKCRTKECKVLKRARCGQRKRIFGPLIPCSDEMQYFYLRSSICTSRLKVWVAQKQYVSRWRSLRANGIGMTCIQIEQLTRDSKWGGIYSWIKLGRPYADSNNVHMFSFLHTSKIRCWINLKRSEYVYGIKVDWFDNIVQSSWACLRAVQTSFKLVTACPIFERSTGRIRGDVNWDPAKSSKSPERSFRNRPNRGNAELIGGTLNDGVARHSGSEDTPISPLPRRSWHSLTVRSRLSNRDLKRTKWFDVNCRRQGVGGAVGVSKQHPIRSACLRAYSDTNCANRLENERQGRVEPNWMEAPMYIVCRWKNVHLSSGWISFYERGTISVAAMTIQLVSYFIAHLTTVAWKVVKLSAEPGFPSVCVAKASARSSRQLKQTAHQSKMKTTRISLLFSWPVLWRT